MAGTIQNAFELVCKLFCQQPYYFPSLEVDEHCRFDFIAVYDSPSTTSGLIGQVCGRVKPTFESSSNSLTVVLSTDYANSYRGFSASYSSIYAENVNTSKSCSLAIWSSHEDCVRRNCSFILVLGMAIPVGKPETCSKGYARLTYTLENIHSLKLENQFCSLLRARGS